jgi:hypothetical protein
MSGEDGGKKMSSAGDAAGDVAVDDDLAIEIRDRLFVIPGVREIVEELLAPRGPGLHSACNSSAGTSVSAETLPPDIAIPPVPPRRGERPMACMAEAAAPPRRDLHPPFVTRPTVTPPAGRALRPLSPSRRAEALRRRSTDTSS